jgi:hypothetical protein
MTKLYELTGDMKELEKLDIDSETLNDTLDGIVCEFNDKAVAILECPQFTASLRKGVESVDITDQSKLPDDYVTIEVVEKPDKAAIKRDLKAGKEISGACLKRGETTIVIK